jgi:hypothetical protein
VSDLTIIERLAWLVAHPTVREIIINVDEAAELLAAIGNADAEEEE